MRNIKLTLEYDGSRYNGWTQPPKKGNKNTISGKMIDVLSRMESLPPNTDNPVLFCPEKKQPPEFMRWNKSLISKQILRCRFQKSKHTSITIFRKT